MNISDREIRIQLAGMAMQSLIAGALMRDTGDEAEAYDETVVALSAWKMADAMLSTENYPPTETVVPGTPKTNC